VRCETFFHLYLLPADRQVSLFTITHRNNLPGLTPGYVLLFAVAIKKKNQSNAEIACYPSLKEVHSSKKIGRLSAY
jgi:hypothetical protein